MVVRCSRCPDILVHSYCWFLGHCSPFKMHQSSKFLRRSRGTKHTHGRNYALSTSSDGMAASNVTSPKDTNITHFLDWSIVSISPNILNLPVLASKIYC